MKTFGLLVLTMLAMTGCSPRPPQIISASAPAKVGIPPPSASEADLAIVTVQQFKPTGSKKTVQDFIATATLLSSLSSFKEIGWGAEPDGDSWKVTNVYIGSTAVERRAQWRVDLKTRSVSPLNEQALDLDNHAKKL